jgi:hypothetical protein
MTGTAYKTSLQELFVAARTCLPGLTAVWEYTYRSTGPPFILCGPYRKYASSSSTVACIRFRGNVFNEPLPGNCMGYTYRYTDWWEGIIIFLIPFYLQAVHVHLANGVNLRKAWRGVLSSTPPYLTGSRPSMSVGNNPYKLHLKNERLQLRRVH